MQASRSSTSNREPSGRRKLGPKAAFVGSNEVESGTLETKAICKLLGGKGNILVIEGQLSNQAAVQRTKDIHEVIATPDCSGIKIIAEPKHRGMGPHQGPEP